MNPGQATGQASLIAGMLAAYIAGKGWLPIDVANEIILGLFTIGLAIWTWRQSSTPVLVAAVGEIAKQPDSPVKGVVMASTQEGTAIANSIPGPTVVPAGTAQAATMAKSGPIEPVRNIT